MLLTNTAVIFFIEPYKNIIRRTYTKEIKYIVINTALEFFLLTLLLFSAKLSDKYSRLMVFRTYGFFALLSYAGRQIWKAYLHKLSKSSISNSNKKVLVLTDSKHLNKLLENINEYNYEMYEVVGLCFIDSDRKGEIVEKYKVVADKSDVLSYICHNWIDEVYIASNLERIPREILNGLATAGIATSILINKLDEFEGQDQTIRKMFNTQVLSTSIRQRSTYQMFIKRVMDIFGGIIGCIITLLLMIIIGPIIKIKSPGPVFYKQERIGQNGKHFYMYKFRSMVKNADKLKESLMSQNRIKDGMMFKVKDDPRIIPGIGEFIRKTSIDEFPQFFNVLIGDMSLVGTRPPTVDEWVKYKLEHRIRMAIKPGITGLWQINGRSKITDFNKVIEYDTKYINNWSVALDIEILLKTVKVLLSKREEEAM